ncbi:cache domain-containing sensor histidine kinase [Paenibacillus hamazuiensis]|uniref:cache domain-containing sensor histidine kinase n=1 Tax=Paenibacillus hamazuiensis TaxID=2936508 RepID=UPI00200E9379|nr:sensor histidine kinase [Paenibacillus hamazuiensis]
MLSPFKRFRIDYLLSGSFAGLFVLLLTLVSYISYSLSAKEIAANTSYYQQGLLNELNKQVVIQMRAIEQVSLSISRNTAVQDYLRLSGDYYEKTKAQNDLSKDLSEIINSTPSIQSIRLYTTNPSFSDPKGSVSFVPNTLLYSEPWYGIVEKSDFAWIGERTVETPTGTQSVVTFARKVYSGTLDNLGLLLINVKAKTIHAIVSEEMGGPQRYLLDSGGRPLIHTQPPEERFDLSGLADGMQSPTGYVRYRTDKGDFTGKHDYLIVWAKSFNDGWLLLELTPWQHVTEGSLKLAVTLFSIGLGTVLVALFFTFYLSKSFMKPISILLQAMGRFSLDARPPELPNDYRNEFGVLFHGYRRLTGRIEELYRSLEEQHIRQRKAEIQALQAMINPHFLYNTLDQLNWMAIDAGQERMSQVLELMGRMFRIGLSNGDSLITIGQELTHTECYLQIQQLRRGEGLTYSIQADDSIKDLYIPKLTLQPFVENAVLHGFHGRSRGHIDIAAEDRGEALIFTIEDDGAGLAPGWDAAPRRKTGGYGIRNVRKRLDAYFGAPYGISIEPRSPEGTRIVIRIPKLDQPEGGFADVEHRDHR